MSAGTDASPGEPGQLARRPAWLIRRALASLVQDTGIVVGTVVAANLLRVVSSVALTRLLAPEVFGAAGIIGSIFFVLVMMSDLGFQAFVVRHGRGDEARFLDAVWTIRLIRAVILTITLLVLARPIAAGLGKPDLAGLIAASSLFFLVEGCGSLSLLTALRRGLLLRLSLMELGVSVLQIVASIFFAVLWRDAWAIVAAILLASVTKTAASYLLFSASRQRWLWDRDCLADLWGFARFVMGSSIISMVQMQADKVVLAWLLPLDRFGLYVLAGNLALAPMVLTSAYGSRVLYPLFARTWREHPKALPAIFYAARWRGSLAYMVGAGGLIGVAPLLVQLLYDDRYADAATYLRLLAIAPFFSLCATAANEVLTATGHVRTTFHLSIVRFGWLVIAAPLGFAWLGPVGLIAAVAGAEGAAAVFGSVAIYRIGLFRPVEEAMLLCAGALGIAVGCLANAKLGVLVGVGSF